MTDRELPVIRFVTSRGLFEIALQSNRTICVRLPVPESIGFMSTRDVYVKQGGGDVVADATCLKILEGVHWLRGTRLATTGPEDEFLSVFWEGAN